MALIVAVVQLQWYHNPESIKIIKYFSKIIKKLLCRAIMLSLVNHCYSQKQMS